MIRYQISNSAACPEFLKRMIESSRGWTSMQQIDDAAAGKLMPASPDALPSTIASTPITLSPTKSRGNCAKCGITLYWSAIWWSTPIKLAHPVAPFCSAKKITYAACLCFDCPEHQITEAVSRWNLQTVMSTASGFVVVDWARGRGRGLVVDLVSGGGRWHWRMAK